MLPTIQHPYEYNPAYTKRTAYFCMEFGIDQALKVYSGGLGYLAGSHMRSGYELKQNLIGIGILWKYGYYDQVRKADNSMDVLFQEKGYSYLEDKGIIVTVNIDNHQVYVKALYLNPETFGTVPMYFLTTDIPENDFLARTITHKLYDGNTASRVAQNIVLGIGGAKVIDALGGVDCYHMNEAHALSLAFHLYSKSKNIEEVKKRIVFTTHTPEKAGNEEHNINLLDKMGFFCGLPLDDVRQLTSTWGDMFSHSLVALRMSKIANGVSALHGEVSREMWGEFSGICEITSVTNAQNKKYWQDQHLAAALEANDDTALLARKRRLKERLINTIADQTGKLFDPDKIIVVWARRFAEYKRPDLIKRDIMRFNRLVAQTDLPIQLIWAGKPYPTDEYAKSVFNHLVSYTKSHANCAVLTGYELTLSALLKKGADVWLNNPRRPREASGTSGMTAAMNGAVNVSINDGWIPEFSKHGVNSYLLPVVSDQLPIEEVDNQDAKNLMDCIENEVLPTYYNTPDQWLKIVKQSMLDVVPAFDSNRMADEYYKLYNL